MTPIVCLQGLTQVEFYPFPIPDVFVGRPLLVAGKFEGQWPEEVTLLGNLPDGTTWSQSVPTLPAGPLPLQHLFAKSQLDLMTANAWLAGAAVAVLSLYSNTAHHATTNTRLHHTRKRCKHCAVANALRIVCEYMNTWITAGFFSACCCGFCCCCCCSRQP